MKVAKRRAWVLVGVWSCMSLWCLICISVVLLWLDLNNRLGWGDDGCNSKLFIYEQRRLKSCG